MEEYLLEAMLHGISEIHVALGNFRMRLARMAEELLHPAGEVAGEPDCTIR